MNTEPTEHRDRVLKQLTPFPLWLFPISQGECYSRHGQQVVLMHVGSLCMSRAIRREICSSPICMYGVSLIGHTYYDSWRRSECRMRNEMRPAWELGGLSN